MPVYEYECNVHGVFEKFHSMSSYPQEDRCPECYIASPKIISMARIGIDTKTFEPGYKHSVARYPGDPEGFCKSKEDTIAKLSKRGIHREDMVFKGEE